MHQCEICNKEFKYQSQLKQHVLVHTGEKPHKCDVCKKEFKQKSYLNKHILIHATEATHHCDICKRQFTLKKDLEAHILTHGGQSTHPCDICGKLFSQKSSLNQHRLLHTGESSSQSINYKQSQMPLVIQGRSKLAQVRNNMAQTPSVPQKQLVQAEAKSTKIKVTEGIFQFKVTFKIPRGHSGIHRKMEVRGATSLYRFAEIILYAFNFQLNHVFAFYDNIDNIHESSEIYTLLFDDGVPISLKEKSVKHSYVCNVFRYNKKMGFLFDYGAEWRFIVECTGFDKPEAGERYPMITKKIGPAPLQYTPYSERILFDGEYEFDVDAADWVESDSSESDWDDYEESSSDETDLGEGPPYYCSKCMIPFSRIDNLRMHHMCAHGTENLWECEVCHKDFAQWSIVNHHVKEKHTVISEEPIPLDWQHKIFTFKINLRFGKEDIHRILELEGATNLHKFAEEIVHAFNFKLDHAFAFHDDVYDMHESKEVYTLFKDESIPIDRKEKSVKNSLVYQVFKPKKRMGFLFDYGDSWNFVVECLGFSEPVAGKVYPVVTKEVGKAPPQYQRYEDDLEDDDYLEEDDYLNEEDDDLNEEDDDLKEEDDDLKEEDDDLKEEDDDLKDKDDDLKDVLKNNDILKPDDGLKDDE